MLEFRNVSARFAGFQALHDVSLAVNPGELVAIFGHNGAGKTTLLRCGMGDVADTDGTVTYNGTAVTPGAVTATPGWESASCRTASTCSAT